MHNFANIACRYDYFKVVGSRGTSSLLDRPHLSCFSVHACHPWNNPSDAITPVLLDLPLLTAPNCVCAALNICGNLLMPLLLLHADRGVGE